MLRSKTWSQSNGSPGLATILSTSLAGSPVPVICGKSMAWRLACAFLKLDVDYARLPRQYIFDFSAASLYLLLLMSAGKAVPIYNNIRQINQI